MWKNVDHCTKNLCSWPWSRCSVGISHFCRWRQCIFYDLDAVQTLACGCFFPTYNSSLIDHDPSDSHRKIWFKCSNSNNTNSTISNCTAVLPEHIFSNELMNCTEMHGWEISIQLWHDFWVRLHNVSSRLVFNDWGWKFIFCLHALHGGNVLLGCPQTEYVYLADQTIVCINCIMRVNSLPSQEQIHRTLE